MTSFPQFAIFLSFFSAISLALPAAPVESNKVAPGSLNPKLAANTGLRGLTLPGSFIEKRARRSAEHVITDCMTVASEEGNYYFKGDTGGEVCGLYLLTDPDRRVHLTLDYADIPCSQGGLVSLFDGWELNREYFPAEEDHPLPMRRRFMETCNGAPAEESTSGRHGIGGQQRKTLMSNQNAALVQFRVPIKSRGFAVTVRFPRNPAPCNILLEGTADVYTLRNYGKSVNCSLASLFPARVTVLSLSVGMATNIKRNLELETGTIHKCGKRGMPDYVEVGGSEGLDTRHLALADSICGLDSKPGSTEETVLCGVTAVRLVSSGDFDNAVTVAVRPASEDDLAAVVCGL
ncbi:corticotropin-releasing factor-binding protein [Neocloeon triangulifer]|uniref:corticotropin-releasing factor-binding protein n=1 Tax=Neocloeon triangulifer TaxID=2078957 RepID=UPI00286F7A99|nr:corticotropin-releasing factor-binding protein [Neocloeon triangulifer]